MMMMMFLVLFSSSLIIVSSTCGNIGWSFKVATDVDYNGKFGGTVYAALKFGSGWTSWRRLDNVGCVDFTSGWDRFNDFESELETQTPSHVAFYSCSQSDYWSLDAIRINNLYGHQFSPNDCTHDCENRFIVCNADDLYSIRGGDSNCKKVAFDLNTHPFQTISFPILLGSPC